METSEIIDKIGRENLKKAIESNDPNALQALIEETGLELTDEQIELIAGGSDDFTSSTDPLRWEN